MYAGLPTDIWNLRFILVYWEQVFVHSSNPEAEKIAQSFLERLMQMYNRYGNLDATNSLTARKVFRKYIYSKHVQLVFAFLCRAALTTRTHVRVKNTSQSKHRLVNKAGIIWEDKTANIENANCHLYTSTINVLIYIVVMSLNTPENSCRGAVLRRNIFIQVSSQYFGVT